VAADVTTPEPIRVIVADDQTAVREGLVTLLELLDDVTVVAAAADGEQAIAGTLEHAPDVVLMDLRMPGIDGVAATRRIRTEVPATHVVVLTTYSDDASILEALDAGALGYLTKDAGRAEIARALHAAAAGQSVLDPTVAARLVTAARRTDSPATMQAPTPPGGLPDGLTTREAEVITLIAAGLDNRAIARRLYLSDATVKTHINHAFAKIGATSRAQAVTYAYQHGLADTPRSR
jgi:DNA-binding NarL/FixJ family response regulator